MDQEAFCQHNFIWSTVLLLPDQSVMLCVNSVKYDTKKLLKDAIGNVCFLAF